MIIFKVGNVPLYVTTKDFYYHCMMVTHVVYPFQQLTLFGLSHFDLTDILIAKRGSFMKKYIVLSTALVIFQI